MAKLVALTYMGKNYSLPLEKLDRTKLYGTKKRVPLDRKGRVCTRASLTLDGKHVLKAGMTAQAYFTQNGRLVSRNEMVGIDDAGNVVDTVPSSLGQAQELEGPVNFEELLDLDVDAVYYLGPISGNEDLAAVIDKQQCFKFQLNYNSSLEKETAYLISNDDGFFALLGKKISIDWIAESEIYVTDVADEEDDDLDFETL